ncbi:MAG: hypothetical protein A2018_00675 [Alphaproteobacteria bacterium GWF2_58_20]|nr:MAG: hypothetical protein A2018_00675 [Alphaproteobacteria bacterium GWF2_58_20]
MVHTILRARQHQLFRMGPQSHVMALHSLFKMIQRHILPQAFICFWYRFEGYYPRPAYTCRKNAIGTRIGPNIHKQVV